MINEELIKCPKTGGDACLEIKINPQITNYVSYSCGFWTNTLMKKGEEFFETQISTLPELYKDLAWEDPETNLVWLPTTVNDPKKGMVFAYGTNPTQWKWASVRSIPIPEEDRKNHPIPGKPGEFMEYRMDMVNMKLFDERDYIEALDYIGVFEGNLEN
jgi:hypothetical protein